MTLAAARILSIALALAALFTVLVPDTGSAQGRDRYDRRMVIVNDTGRVIYAFHATNTGVRTWGRDLLGSSVIQPGQQYVFNFDDTSGYCMFDFKAVLDNGRAIERYRVDVCTFATWTVR
jgi:hypothetical protein